MDVKERIFDALLFRMVAIPYQIFDKAYEEAPSLFPGHITACEWREIRIYAEKYARERKGKEEITLAEIYRELPDIIENRKEIMEAEISAEKKNTYLNPYIKDILQTVKKRYGKKILLISDMYLPEKSMKGILSANHLDLSMIDHIFVSSEYGKKKSDGSLYMAVCEEVGCAPDRILHIGDNWNADYRSAKRMGLQAIYYPVVSEGKYRHPYLEYEQERYGAAGQEIYSLRLLAAECSLKGREKEWFQMGAMVLGPLLTYAADWVLDLAEEYGIRNIYPMMREGYFLTKLLKRAAEERGFAGNITPMYISRKALYPALFAVLKKKDIAYLLGTRKMTVGRVIDLFGLQEAFPDLLPWRELYLCDAKEVSFEGESVYKILEKYLSRPDVIDKIRKSNENADEELWDYLTSLKMDCEDFITFDVGWRGNSQNAIERIRRKRKAVSHGLHLLITGKKEVLKERNLEDGTDLRGFSANFGENVQDICALMIPAFEMLMLCREGTTTGYQRTKDGVAPVCKEILYGEHQMKSMETVQAGILSFQTALYAACREKGRRIRQEGGELLKLASRLMAYPLKKEAMLLGDMQYDQNFGIDEIWNIISPENLRHYEAMGYNAFTHQKLAREDEWYPGMDVCIDSLVHYRRLMFHKRAGFSYQYAMYAERVCQSGQSFVLVGAGNRLKEMLMYIRMMAEEEKIESIVDNDTDLQKENILGCPIRALESKTQSRLYAITVSQRETVEELTRHLRRIKGTGITIMSLYS